MKDNTIGFGVTVTIDKDSLAQKKSLNDLIAVAAQSIVEKNLFEKVTNINIDTSGFQRMDVTIDVRLVKPDSNVVSFAEAVAENPRNIQEAFDNAFAKTKGFAHVEEMLDSIPVEKRLPDNYTRREKINHAMAIISGFDSVEDMMNSIKDK